MVSVLYSVVSWYSVDYNCADILYCVRLLQQCKETDAAAEVLEHRHLEQESRCDKLAEQVNTN